MPRAKQLTVWIPDRPGTLGEVGSALGAKKINIKAFTAWGEGDRGGVRVIVDKPAAAKKVCAANGWEAAEEEVLEVAAPHTPGSLGRIAKKLGDAGINIRYSYSGTGGGARKAMVYFGVSDLKAALKAAR